MALSGGTDPDARSPATAALGDAGVLPRIAAHVPGVIYLARRTATGQTDFVFVSETARGMLQLAPHERTDDPLAFFSRVHPDDLARLFAELDAAGRAGRALRHAYRVRLPDGEVRWQQAEATPEAEPDGSVLWHGFVTDITEQRQVQAQVEAANASLERHVAERTADLQRMLSDMEAVAYSIAHDLRTPLRSINGFAALMREQDGQALSAPAHDALERIVQASTRMGRLLTDLLALLEVVRLDLHPDEVDMERLAHEVSAQLGLSAAGVQLRVDAMPTAWGDAAMLRQALQHLLDNAVKFSRGRTPAQVHVGYDSAQRAYVVRDNGIGFDPLQSTRLFEPFQRLHNDPPFPGMGIGLAIVARIAQRHGGKAWAHSTPGQGSAFWLRVATRRTGSP